MSLSNWSPCTGNGLYANWKQEIIRAIHDMVQQHSSQVSRGWINREIVVEYFFFLQMTIHPKEHVWMLWADSKGIYRFTRIGIPIKSQDRLFCITGIHILVRRCLYTESDHRTLNCQLLLFQYITAWSRLQIIHQPMGRPYISTLLVVFYHGHDIDSLSLHNSCTLTYMMELFWDIASLTSHRHEYL